MAQGEMADAALVIVLYNLAKADQEIRDRMTMDDHAWMTRMDLKSK